MRHSILSNIRYIYRKVNYAMDRIVSFIAQHLDKGFWINALLLSTTSFKNVLFFSNFLEYIYTHPA